MSLGQKARGEVKVMKLVCFPRRTFTKVGRDSYPYCGRLQSEKGWLKKSAIYSDMDILFFKGVVLFLITCMCVYVVMVVVDSGGG